MKEFRINEYLTLRLENNETVIYVKGKRFLQCKYLLLNVPIEKATFIEDLKSVDEVSDTLDNTLEFTSLTQQKPLIPPEVEFWGHCSNLQVWYENDYNTALLHSNIAFPLLRALYDVGDSLAKKVFVEEIARRFDSEYLPVMLFLLIEGYLDYLTVEQIESLNFFNKIKDLSLEKDNKIGKDLKAKIFDNFRQYIQNFRPKTANEWIVKVNMVKTFVKNTDINEMFTQALQQFPNSEELHMAYIRNLNERGNQNKAKEIMKKLINIAPQNALYLIGFGVMKMQQGEYEEAIKYFQKSLDVNPEIDIAKLHIAEVNHALHQYAKRDKILMEFYNMKDLKLPFLKELALFSNFIRKFTYSIPLLKKVLYYTPDDPDAWFELALAYRELCKHLHSRRCLKKTKVFGQHPKLLSEALNLLGLTYIESDTWHVKKSIECFKESIQLDPYNESAWANQTPVYAMLMDLERSKLAIEISKKIVELKEVSNLGNTTLIERVEQELHDLKIEYWNTPFKCPFCHIEFDIRPDICPSCNNNLNHIFKDSKSKELLKIADSVRNKEIILGEQVEIVRSVKNNNNFTHQKDQNINLTLAEELTPKEEGLIKMYWPSMDFGHRGEVECMAISPDNKYLISGDLHNKIKIWDLENRVHLKTLIGHEGWIWDVVFYKDMIISGAWDGTIRIWDIHTGKCLHILESPKDRDLCIDINTLIITSDGFIISELSEGNHAISDWIEIWNLKTKKLVRTIESGLEHFYSLVQLPQENQFAGILDFDNIGIIDINTGQILRVISDLVDPPDEYEEHSYLTDLILSPDKKYFFTITYSGVLKKINVETGEVVGRKEFHGFCKTIKTFSNQIAVSRGWNIHLLDIATLTQETLLQSPEPFRGVHDNICAMVLTSDFRYLICSMNTRIGIWDLQRKVFSPLAGLKLSSFTSKVRGNYAITLLNDKFFYWDLLTGDVINHTQARKDSYFLYTSHKGKYFASGISSSSNSPNHLWSIETLEYITEIRDYYINTFNEDGTLFAGTQWINLFPSLSRNKREEGLIAVFEIPSKRLISQHKIHSEYVNKIAFSPDNIHIASSSRDNTIKIWDFHTGEIKLTINNFEDIRPLMFSPDGKYLIGGSPWRGASTFTFWDAKDGKEIRKIRQGSGFINVFSFSNNGKYFASGGSEEVYVWDFDKGISYGPFCHLSSIDQIAFIKDDKYLIVIDKDGNVYMWDYLQGNINQIIR